MRAARLLPTLAVGTCLAVLVAPATAAAKKPITKSFDITIPVPFPANQATSECETTTAGPSEHNEVVKVPAAGTLEVVISGFAGDWDGVIRNSKGQSLALTSGTDAASPGTNATDKAKVKIKKADTITIEICNFAGGPTGKGKYTFTYAK